MEEKIAEILLKLSEVQGLSFDEINRLAESGCEMLFNASVLTVIKRFDGIHNGADREQLIDTFVKAGMLRVDYEKAEAGAETE